MATEHGTATTGFGEGIGRLVPGAAADIVLMDWRQIAFPFLDEGTDVLSAVVQRAKTGGVESVMAAGEAIYRERRYIRVDKEAALNALADLLKRPRTEEDERRRPVSRRVLPFMRDFYAHHLPKAEPFHADSARR